MSAAALVTFGYGSFATVNQAAIFGYLGSSAPAVVTPDTHDLPRRSTAGYKKYLKQRQKLLDEKQEEKRLEAETLRRQIDEARGIFPPDDEIIESEQAVETPPAPYVPKPYVSRMPELLHGLALLEAHLKLLDAQKKSVERQQRQLKDEDEIQIILEALSFPRL